MKTRVSPKYSVIYCRLNTIEVYTSTALSDSYISHDEFVLINNVLKEYEDMKEEIKSLKTSSTNQRF